MDLIKKIYEDKSEHINSIRKVIILYDKFEKIDCFMKFLVDSYYFDTDLYLPEFEYNIQEIFSRLGIELNESIILKNMKIGPSRYNVSQDGYCVVNYQMLDSENSDDNTIAYYSSNELFPGESYSVYPGVKLCSGNESLYYSVGSVPCLRKYSIQLNEDVTLIREYSKDFVLFIIEGKESHLVIRIKKPISKVVKTDYLLDNELAVLDYLKNLNRTYDVMDVYNNLCQLSLGNNVDVYQEITLCESIKTRFGLVDNNVLSVKNGEIDSVVRTIGDKTITLSGNGSWSYSLSDEFVDFKINSGKTMKYHIETKTESEMDDYTDGLFRYDVSVAKREVEETRELVRKRCKLGNKRG